MTDGRRSTEAGGADPVVVPAPLAATACVPCRRGDPTVTDEDVARLRPQIPDWDVVEVDGVKRLTRAFRFADFGEALRFTDRVGALADQEGHHPSLLTEWGRVTVTWWTHTIGGLHVNDLVMAARTDQLHGS